MDIIQKSKNSVSLCTHCKYTQDCTVFANIYNRYDVLSCPMDGPQKHITPEIYQPANQKNKTHHNNELIKDFKTKSIDEKLDMIYEKLMNM